MTKLSRPAKGLILTGIVLLSACSSGQAEQIATPTGASETTATLEIIEATPVVIFPELSMTASPTATSVPPSEPENTEIPPVSEPASIAYTVQEGDTLLGIAMQYNVSMAAIQMQNEMGSVTVVQVGQTLEIPLPYDGQTASPFWLLYEISEGETLSGIGKTYDLDIAAIRNVNGLNPDDPIRTGQLLILPLNGPAQEKAPDPTASPMPSPTPTTAPVSEASTPAPTEGLPAPASVPAAPPPADIAAWPYETVRIINAVRAENGLPPLAYNETLAQAAQAHANDCAQRGSCSHTGSDGSTIKVRVQRAGYTGRGWAECWAQRKTPQDAVDIWMDEVYVQDDGSVAYGPHLRTLLTTWLTEIGMGVAETSWGYYFIADFGRP